MEGEDSTAALETVRRRAGILSLLTDAHWDKRDLVDSLDVSRSTVDRAIRELQTDALVTRNEDGYVATLPGRILFERYERYVDDVRGVAAVSDLIQHLPVDADVPAAAFADADAYRPTAPDPYRPQQVLRDLVRDSHTLRGLLAAQATPNAPDVIRQQSLEGDLDVEYLISPRMREYLWTERSDLVSTLVEDGGVVFHETDAITFDYGLLDDGTTHFVVVLYTDDGQMAGILVSTADAAVDWAESTFRRLREDATRVDSP
jgi:predicted transcriptional regulator